MKRRRKREGRKKGGEKKEEKKKEEKKKGGEKKGGEKNPSPYGESNPGPFAWKVKTLTVDRPTLLIAWPQALDCMHVYRHTSRISIAMN